DRPSTIARASMLGMRAGYVASGAQAELPPPDFDDITRNAVNAVVRRAAQERDTVLSDGEGSDPVVVYGAGPTQTGTIAWIAYTVRPSGFLGVWRFISVSLSVATLLLVGTAISTVVSVKRGAATLNASLEALANDLGSPVPRPPVPELADLADHIADLAGALA